MKTPRWFALTLFCMACGSDPLRPPSAAHGLFCETSVFDGDRGAGSSDTLLRFWNRGSWRLDTWPRPRLLEARYDSSGRPRQLASIAEERIAAGTTGVEVLLVEFGSNQTVRASHVLFGPDEVQTLDHQEERAYRRFRGPPYLERTSSRDTEGRYSAPIQRIPQPLTPKEVTKARELAAELWKLRCPWNSPATRGRKIE